MKVELALRLNIWNHNPAGGRKNRKESARLLEQVRRIGREVASNLQAFVTTILDRRLADWPPLLGMIRPICGDLRKIPDGGSIFKANTQPPLDDCFHYNAWWNRLFRLKERLILDQLPSTLEKNIEANFKLFNIRPYRLLKWLNKLRQSQVVWKRWGRRGRGILSFPQGEVNIGTGDGRCKGAKSIGETMSR